jgi:two-component system chemotaxis response regulator CheB
VVFSAMTGDADGVLRALEEGAVDVVPKPQVGMRDFLAESFTMLVDTLVGAASAKVARRQGPLLPARPARPAYRGLPALALPRSDHGGETVIAMGASTGGTEALGVVLGALPAEAPAIALVQHMPEGFTRAFARRLDATCAMEVKEATTGDRLGPGRVLVAPGGRHLVLHRAGDEYVAEVLLGPPVSRHRPSIDVLFRSVANVAGDAAIGVILTGMGADGAEGLLEMKRRGATTFAQDEASCVVFGMPKEAIACGAVEEIVALPRMAAALMEQTRRSRSREARGVREGTR